MQSAIYYREQAERAEGLSHVSENSEVSRILKQLARDYVDIAVDLEAGAIKVIHRSDLPQQTHIGPLKS
jgi:hypothetical protein